VNILSKINKTTRTFPFSIKTIPKISIQHSPDLYKMVKSLINRFNEVKKIIFRFKITGVMDSAFFPRFI